MWFSISWSLYSNSFMKVCTCIFVCICILKIAYVYIEDCICAHTDWHNLYILWTAILYARANRLLPRDNPLTENPTGNLSKRSF